jgi:glucose-1-phosphate adenylyltransferase
MDYGPMIAHHVERQADVTVGCIEVRRERAAGEFGIIAINEDDRVVEFAEKPQDPAPLPGREDLTLASMGIYVFKAKFLYEQLIRDADTPKSNHDFGKDVIPAAIDRYRVVAYAFRDVQTGKQNYWRDVGTVDAFWEANIELAGVSPDLNLYDEEWPIWTYQAQLPPAKFVFDDKHRRGMAVDSLISGGCIISGGDVTRSVLFSNVKVHSYAHLKDAVVLPNVDIGRYCRLNKVIIDEGCQLPRETVIGENPEADAARFYISEGGVVLVTPEMLGQQPHYVR